MKIKRTQIVDHLRPYRSMKLIITFYNFDNNSLHLILFQRIICGHLTAQIKTYETYLDIFINHSWQEFKGRGKKEGEKKIERVYILWHFENDPVKVSQLNGVFPQPYV